MSRFQPGIAARYACTGASPSAFAICGLPPERSFTGFGLAAFSGGPFVESRYFGEGIGIAVRKGNDLLRQSLNWALFRLWEKGRYTDLWLRYFSISPF